MWGTWSHQVVPEGNPQPLGDWTIWKVFPTVVFVCLFVLGLFFFFLTDQQNKAVLFTGLLTY